MPRKLIVMTSADELTSEHLNKYAFPRRAWERVKPYSLRLRSSPPLSFSESMATFSKLRHGAIYATA